MSDRPNGPSWWKASDGKWYPPELHPTVKDVNPPTASAPAAGESQPPRWLGQVDRSAHAGPQFPDLFKKALEGSHLADNISVKYGDGDERNVTGPTATRSMAGARTGGTAQRATSASPTTGSSAKRKWRKAH